MLIYAILSHFGYCNFLFTHLSEEGSGPKYCCLTAHLTYSHPSGSHALFFSCILCVLSRSAVYPLMDHVFPGRHRTLWHHVANTLHSLYLLIPELGSLRRILCMLLRALQIWREILLYIYSGISDNYIYNMADVVSEHYQWSKHMERNSSCNFLSWHACICCHNFS